MAQQTLQIADEGPVLTSGSSNLPVTTQPVSGGDQFVPTTTKPVAPEVPIGIYFGPMPVERLGEPAPSKPSGCGGGSCPLATPPAGGTVTITRTDQAVERLAPSSSAPSSAGLPSWLVKTYGGIPLWVWILVGFLALVALTK